MSVLNGHTEWVKLLLGNKPDWSTCDNDGVTPLTVAGHILHTEVVKLPLDNNANLNASRRTDCVTTLQVAAYNKHTKVVNDGVTSLWMAGQKGHKEVVKLLLASKYDLNACDNDGVKPLDCCS